MIERYNIAIIVIQNNMKNRKIPKCWKARFCRCFSMKTWKRGKILNANV